VAGGEEVAGGEDGRVGEDDPMAAIPTTGLLSGAPPMDPWKGASPKAKMPPSEATNQ
jgi:hypothetical protein